MSTNEMRERLNAWRAQVGHRGQLSDDDVALFGEWVRLALAPKEQRPELAAAESRLRSCVADYELTTDDAALIAAELDRLRKVAEVRAKDEPAPSVDRAMVSAYECHESAQSLLTAIVVEGVDARFSSAEEAEADGLSGENRYVYRVTITAERVEPAKGGTT